MKNCPNCDKEITKRRNKFCSQSCATEYAQKQFKINNPDKECMQCKKAIPYSKKFCNRSCSVTYSNIGRIRAEESKKKISDIRVVIAQNKGYSNNFKNEDGSPKYWTNTRKRTIVNCSNPYCDNETHVTDSEMGLYKTHFCSLDCRKKNSGGLRHGSGRGKKGWYKGYYCDSTYELAYVIYNIDNNVNFKRSEIVIPYSYKNKNHNYHPDFENNSTLIEVKGYHTEQVDAKIKATKEAGYNLQMLYKDDLKYAFDYVKDNYKYKNIEDLYETK